MQSADLFINASKKTTTAAVAASNGVFETVPLSRILYAAYNWSGYLSSSVHVDAIQKKLFVKAKKILSLKITILF